MVESVLAPLPGGSPQAPLHSTVSWLTLAAVRRELGIPKSATSVAASVTTGQPLLPSATVASVPAPAATNTPPVISTVVLGAPNASSGVVTGTVKASDPNGDTLTYKASVASTARGKVTITSAGVFTYTPTSTARHAAAKVGAGPAVTTDTVTVTVTDSKGAAVTQAVSVPVSPRNSAPTATSTVGTPNAATGVVTGKVTGSDADKDTLSYAAPATTAKGAVAINAGTGAFTYTPTVAARQDAGKPTATAADKSDSFTVTVTDGYGGSRAVAVKVAVSPVAQPNGAPVIGSVAVGTPSASSGVVTGTVKASDPNGDTLTYRASVASSARGKVTISSAGVFTYTPTATARHAAAKAGAGPAVTTDTVTVTVTDSKGAAVTQAVSVPVSPRNSAPTATSTVGTPNAATGVVTGKVTGSDADKDTLSYAAPATTAKGAVAINAGTGAFTYTPTVAARQDAGKPTATAADKSDSFTVTVTDGYGGSRAVAVKVTVSPAVQPNQAPVAAAPVVSTPNASTGVVTGSVSATDADGDVVTYIGSTTTGKGTVTVNPNGSFTYTPTAEAQRNAYLPGAPAGDLSDTFTVTASDGYGGSTSVPVNVSVNPLVSYYKTGDVRRDPVTGRIALRTVFPPEQAQPGTGAPGYLNWLIASPNTGALNGFPADFQDWDNLYLVGSTATTTPFNPAVTYSEGAVLRNPQNGAVAIRTIFPEDQGPNLANMAWLVATTSQGGLNVPTSSVQTWDVLFAPNRAPVAATPVVGTPEPSTGVVIGSVSATDPDGDNLTYSGSTTTSKGSVTVAANGNFTYAPTATARENAGKIDATAADKTDNFTVTVTDGKGGTASVPVEVVVRPFLNTGDIIQQPGGTWRAVYAPNVTSWGSNWLGVNPGNGGIWLSDSDVNGWLDVTPPTGAETAGSGPYSAGDIKVPPGSLEGSVTWFAVKTGAPLSNSYSWMTCSVSSACNTASDTDVIAGSPVAQWVDLRLSR